MVSQDNQPQKRWFQHILHPSWLAGIISVGFHGGIFAAGPTFSGLNFDVIAEPDLAAETRKVPLITLTPEEQRRLPDFSQSFYDFSDFGELPPLESLTAGDSEKPVADNDLALSQSDDFSAYTPAPPLNFSIAPSQSSSQPQSTPLPPLQTNENLPAANETPGEIPDLSEESPVNGNNPSASNPADQNRSETPEVANESGAADLQGYPVNSAETPPKESDSSSDSSNDVAAAPSDNQTTSLRERLQQTYAYNATGTTPEEADARFTSWLEEGTALIDDSEFNVTDPIQLSVNYGQQRCLQTAPKDGLIGALADAEGNLLEDPTVLRSTGYFFINQQAMQFIQSRDFSSVQAPTAFRFEISINYDPDICIDLGQNLETSPETQSHQGTESPSDAEIVQDSNTNPDSNVTQE